MAQRECHRVPPAVVQSVDNSLDALLERRRCPLISESTDINQGAIMAKREKRSKVQNRAKLRRGKSANRRKARKVTKSARKKAPKRTVARAPERATVKKPVMVEAVVVEKAPPDAIIVTEGLDPAA